MAEPTVLDPLSFDHFPQIDPSVPTFFDSHQFPEDFTLPQGFTSDLDFDDINLDFPLDDFFEDQEFPPSDGLPSSDSKEGSGVSSSSPVSGNHSFDQSGNANPSSPDSGHSRTCSPGSGDCMAASGVVNQDVKLEEERNGWGLKRKKDKEDESANPNLNPNPRSSKFRRSEESSSSGFLNAGSEEEEKRNTRLMRNRESAQLSRQRKKHYVEELEDKVRKMQSTITDLNSKISFVMAENASLRQQLGGKGGNGTPSTVYPPPAPMGPMPFPWIPYTGYPLRPNGSQVPLIPIPRLKPQQPAPATKSKKSESKKSESKTKKVASVSLLGLLFVLMIFGGIVPGVNLRSRGNSDVVSRGFGVVKGSFSGWSQGRILSVSGRANCLNNTDEFGLCSGKLDFGAEGLNRPTGKRSQDEVVGSETKEKERGTLFTQNTSESLPALLYVPRNDKHVKINGNLIIHSVLAAERAMTQAKSRDQVKQSSGKEGSETGLAIAGNVASALAVPRAGTEVGRQSYRNSAEPQRALASDFEDSFRDTLKSSPADGTLQQWFREGLAGPVLNSGMCTEVFQFEISPSSASPGGIVPATSVVNATERFHLEKKMKNRRILYPYPIPLPGSTLNDTHHFEKPSENSNFRGNNNSVPSMVVSVMADPRDVGDGDGDGMIAPKSLPRILVVVLMDSVKYVTYSCVLPLKSHGPHLVN